MKVGLVQVDGKLPNLALMQIAGYHLQKGDIFEWYKGRLFDQEYGKVYASKIFSFSQMPDLPEDAVIGGTGIDFTNNLPEDIKACKPSYHLYPNCNFHVGFSMKGCRFRCSFCCVPQKEGKPFVNSSIHEILTNPNGGNRLMLLDNDFFGGRYWKDNLEQIIELKLKVCFVQGLNIRIITREQAELLAKCNYQNSQFDQKYLTFAWDRYDDGKLIRKGIDICNEAGIPSKHMMFFVLIGYNKSEDSKEQDIQRVEALVEMGCRPFIMKYEKEDPYQKAFARWINKYNIFKKTLKEYGSVRSAWDNYKYNKVFSH